MARTKPGSEIRWLAKKEGFQLEDNSLEDKDQLSEKVKTTGGMFRKKGGRSLIIIQLSISKAKTLMYGRQDSKQ